MAGYARRAGMLGLSCFTGLLVLAACQEAPPEKPAEPPASTMPDRQKELLVAAATIALPPSGVEPGDLPEPQSQGAKLSAKYCAQCHDLPAPTAHSATDWPSVVRRMWLRMDALPDSYHVEVPTRAERSTMLSYLTGHALEVSGATLPPGAGREAFSEACSQCHALPDPRVHSSQDWPAVFQRMERNIERMKLKPMTREQTAGVLHYLQDVASRH